jgi:hypothetical protein
MTPVEQERERCAKLVAGLIRRNQSNVLLVQKLKEVLTKIRNPKSTGTHGGLLNEQLELPFDN